MATYPYDPNNPYQYTNVPPLGVPPGQGPQVGPWTGGMGGGGGGGWQQQAPWWLAAGAQGLNMLFGWRNNRQQRQQQQQRENMLMPFIQGGGSDFLQQMLMSPGSAFNVGQDSIMQTLRADPQSVARTNMESLAGSGNPFDTSEVFRTLTALDDRNRREALGDVRGSASGLGQRFGSAMRREEGALVQQLLENAAARNAQIAMGSHEAAQGRRLQATQQLTARDQVMGQLAAMLSQLGLAGGQAHSSNQLGALNLLFGQPLQQGYNPSGDMMALANLLLAYNDNRGRDQGAN